MSGFHRVDPSSDILLPFSGLRDQNPAMTLPRSVHRHARAALGLLVASVFASGAAPSSSAGGNAPDPPVELAESRPVESVLGNPALPAALDTWLDLIQSAQRSLDFEEFYLSTWPGEPTEPLLAALGAAARRGVRVRLLLDARMHGTYPRTADSLARLPGFEARTV